MLQLPAHKDNTRTQPCTCILQSKIKFIELGHFCNWINLKKKKNLRNFIFETPIAEMLDEGVSS